jgi:hypothetical protein
MTLYELVSQQKKYLEKFPKKCLLTGYQSLLLHFGFRFHKSEKSIYNAILSILREFQGIEVSHPSAAAVGRRRAKPTDADTIKGDIIHSVCSRNHAASIPH